MATAREQILAYLNKVGEVTNDRGKATTDLFEALPSATLAAIRQVLPFMEDEGLLVRETRGKRTYRIALPQKQLSALQPDPEPDLSQEGIDYDRLALALLRKTVEAAGLADEIQALRRQAQQYDQVCRDLQKAREQITALRGQVQAKDTLIAQGAEALRVAQNNAEVWRQKALEQRNQSERHLTSIHKLVDGETRVQVARLMSELPKGN